MREIITLALEFLYKEIFEKDDNNDVISLIDNEDIYKYLLLSLVIPEGIEEIDPNAFCYGCTYVRSIHIPTTIKQLHPDTLKYMFNLHEIYIKDAKQIKMLEPALRNLFECIYNRSFERLERPNRQLSIISEQEADAEIKNLRSTFLRESLLKSKKNQYKQVYI